MTHIMFFAMVFSKWIDDPEKDTGLRLHIVLLLSLLGLSSCVYYGDIHGHAKPLTASDLKTTHRYQPVFKPLQTRNWGNTFHDPELTQLIAIALTDSPTLQIAQSRLRRAQSLTQGAAAALFPSIDFSGYVQRERFAEFGLIPPPFNGHTYNIGTLGLNFNYDFDFWGKHKQILAARVSEACATQADLAESRLIISAAVAYRYFQLLNDMAQTNLAKQNAQLSQTIYDIVVYRAKHGIESDIPVQTALSNKESAQLYLEQCQQDEKLSRNQLAILLGKNPFTTTMVTQHVKGHPPLLTLPHSLTANVLAHRPDINAAKLRVEAAAHRVNAAKARFFPDIQLSALFSYQSVGLGHLFENDSQNNAITGAIDLPIFDAGARRANLGVKYADYDLAVNDYNQTLLTALREVADQLTILKSVQAKLHSQQIALQATAHTYQLFTSRYHHGIIDYVALLETKQLWLQNQAAHMRLQTQHQQATVAMLKALGVESGDSND